MQMMIMVNLFSKNCVPHFVDFTYTGCTFRIILNNKCERQSPCHISDFSGDSSSVSLISMIHNLGEYLRPFFKSKDFLF